MKKPASRLSGILTKLFLLDIVKGLLLTQSYLTKEKFTVQYPKVRPTLRPRFRGALRLIVDPEHGEELCIGCQLCEKACPDDCIVVTMEKRKDPGHNNFKTQHKSFEIDLSRCMWCDLCVEACPTAAIVSTEDYELACYNRDDMKYDITNLYGPLPKKVYTA